MSDVVLVAVLGLVGSLAGSLLGILASNKLTNYRLEQLEKKVGAHNNLIDRTYKLERNFEVLSRHVDDLHKHDE